MLYSRPDPVGAVMFIVPVNIIHVGCTVTLAAGAAGGAGILFTIIDKAGEIHPDVIFLTVIL